MQADRWQRVNRALDVILDSDPAQWRKVLDETCGDDVEFRAEVEGLLSRYDAARRYLDDPPAAAAAALLEEAGGDLPGGPRGRSIGAGPPMTKAGDVGSGLRPGGRLGHYEIVSVIGSGGMGKVWKARDTKLHREVAIKTLPPELARSPERLARLEREARSLAAVSHPRVAAIHGLEEDAGISFLVLEFADGETLADRLARGAIPVKRSLEIALQIAEALEAAHGAWVVHRDLKPANITINPDGHVKVLDFGLAKTFAGEGADSAPGVTVETGLGTILGTPPYMSPEQARGEAVGPQSDIWAFGVVLYEMLTGRSPFERGSTAGTLARVLEAEPDYGSLPAHTPASVGRLLRRCLAKDTTRRLKSAGDVRIMVEDALEALATGPEQSAPPAGAWAGLPWTIRAMGLFALAAGAVFSAWWIAPRAAPRASADVARLSIRSEQRPSGWPFGVQRLAISNDGALVAFAGEAGISIRRMRDGRATVLDHKARYPFFSPDGEWIGFLADADGGYQVAPSGGGAAIPIAPLSERGTGATWGPDDTIVFGTTTGLYSVAASGGEPQLLATPDRRRGELLYAWPEFLPDGKSVLFTIVPEGSQGEPRIAWLDPETGEQGIVLTGGTGARYVGSGHLVYAAGGVLAAVPFDPARREPRGQPVTFPEAAIAVAPDNGAPEFAVSPSGDLVYIAPRTPSTRALYWVDRNGNEEPLAIEPGHYGYPRVSPDGSRIAIDISGDNRDIWVWDVRRASLSRLTNGPTEDIVPIWSRDGTRIFFASDRSGNFDIYSQPADGSSEASVELARPPFESPVGFTPDGSRLIFIEEFRDLSILELATADVQPLLHRESADWLADVSPDGRWLAYESDESGDRVEIYVRPFPGVSGRREKVSIAGGRYPRWGPPGSDELYFVDPSGSMMATAVDFSPTLRLGNVARLFQVQPPQRGISSRPYDVSDIDGRFLITRPVAQARNGTDISVVLNWSEELREQVRPR